MDFDQLLEVLQQGITIDFIFNLSLIVLSIIIIIWVKQKASDIVSWRNFQSNTGLSIGSVVRLYERSAIIEGRVIRANMRRIVLETPDMFIMIPMHEFRNREWFIKKTITEDNIPTQCKICEVYHQENED